MCIKTMNLIRISIVELVANLSYTFKCFNTHEQYVKR